MDLDNAAVEDVVKEVERSEAEAKQLLDRMECLLSDLVAAHVVRYQTVPRNITRKTRKDGTQIAALDTGGDLMRVHAIKMETLFDAQRFANRMHNADPDQVFVFYVPPSCCTPGIACYLRGSGAMTCPN